MKRSSKEKDAWAGKSKEDIELAFNQLSKETGLNLAGIARSIGRSASSLSEWRARKVQPGYEDAIRLGVLAAERKDPVEKVAFWLELCGYAGKLKPEDIEAQITRARSLATAIGEALEEIKKKAKEKAISEEDVSLIVSCFTGQQPLLAKIRKWWSRQAENGGTSCFFWRWHEGIIKRIQMASDEVNHSELHAFWEESITPVITVSPFWAKRRPGDFRLHGFLLAKSDANLSDVKDRLRGEFEKFVKGMRWRPGDKERFRVWIAQYDYPHVTDSWAFVSSEDTFGTLVSENTGLVDKMEASTDPEILLNPYPYCSQVVFLEDGETLKSELQQRYKIDFTSKRVMEIGPQPLSGSKWAELNFSRKS